MNSMATTYRVEKFYVDFKILNYIHILLRTYTRYPSVLVMDGNPVLCERGRGGVLSFTFELISKTQLNLFVLSLPIEHFTTSHDSIIFTLFSLFIENLFSFRFGFWFGSSTSNGVNLPSATDCAVLFDSEALGVSVPSLLLSLAEKKVVSLTKVCILRLMAIMTRFNWRNQVSQILKRNRFKGHKVVNTLV